MSEILTNFVDGLLWLAALIMRGVGFFDNGISSGFSALGLSPINQLYVMLVLTAVLVVWALRALGGMIGWCVLIFLALLLVHRLMPGVTTPDLILQSPLLKAI